VWWENPNTCAWEEYFSALEQYKAGEGNGDPNCSPKYVTKDSPPLKLGTWLSSQRLARKGIGTYRVSDEQIHRLEELGVWWKNPNTHTWEEYFSALERYKAGEGNGDPNCPQVHVTKDAPPLNLGSWLNYQRQAKEGQVRSKNSSEQIRRLDDLGVWWEQPKAWEKYFSALERYRAGEGNGDPNCPWSYATKDTPPLNLGFWLRAQRQIKRKSKLSASKINKLEELGVWWEQPDAWEKYFSALERYRADEGNGDPNCPWKYVTKDTPPLNLGTWLSNQRSAKKSKGTFKISSEQIRRLEELGVWWENPSTCTWEEYFSALEQYKAGEGNGDPNCSTKHVTKDTPPLKLGSWLSTQRRANKGKGTSKISSEQIRRLEDLGLWWENPNTCTWEEYFSALEQYKAGEGNGDPNCSAKYVTKDSPPLKLGSWLSTQRRANKGTSTCQVSVEQIHRLEELGVWWEKGNHNISWEDNFSALERYKNGIGNGDPNCPYSYVTKDTPPLKLGSWLSIQRRVKIGTRKGNLSNEQISKLEDLGVLW